MPKFTVYRSLIYKYGMAFLFTAIAILLSKVFWSIIYDAPFLFIFPAVVLSAWLGGLGPGMVSAALAVILADYFLFAPLYTIFTRPSDVLQFTIFSSIAFLISWLQARRNETEDSLRELKDELEVILNSVTDGITAQDAHGRPVFANVAAARLTGYASPDKMLNTSATDLHTRFEMFDEQDNLLPYSKLPRHEVFKTGQSATLEFKLRTIESNEERWIRLTSAPVFDESGKVKLVVNVLRDITQRIDFLRTASRFEAIIQNSTDAIIGKSYDGYITSWNPGAEKLYGYTADEAIGQHISFIFPKDIESNELLLQERIKQGEQIQHYETRRTHKSGHDVEISLTISPIRTDNGEIVGFSAIGRDITERNRLDHLLEQERRRLTTILNTIPGTVYEGAGDADAGRQRMDFISNYAETMLGYPMDAWKSQSTYNFWKQIVHPDDWEATVARANETYEKGVPGPVRFRGLTKDKEIKYLESYNAVIADHHGKRVGTCGVVLDVTDRRHREQEIMQLTAVIDGQRRQLDGIIRNLPGIIFDTTFNLDTGEQTVNFMSDYVEKMLGYSPDNWQSDPGFWRKIVHPEDWEPTLVEASAAYEDNRLGSAQFRCTHANGDTVYAETFFNFLIEDQQVRQLGVIMDITARKQIEAELEAYTEDLRQSNEELEQFAYVASHDLQEPLRMVTSYLQLIEQRYTDALDDDGREFIDFAVDGASRMKSLITDLLVYSRVQRDTADYTTVSMMTILEQVMHNLQMTIEDSGATITHDELPEITANEGQMLQLLQNLVGNALKFRGEQSPQIHIGVERKKRYWQFSVDDNGIGIEADFKDRIFVIFQRLHTRQEYPGTGIGLAICRRIIDKHDGKIWVESQPDKGSTFYFTIPFKRRTRRYAYRSN